MSVKIDRKLNLVIPVLSDDGESTTYVHSMPIGREVFEKYARLFARTFNIIYTEDGAMTGPRMASLYLRETAEARGQWDGPEGAEVELMGEIRRLTNVIAPIDGKWQTMQWEDARKRQLFDDVDVAEVENAIVFFTLVWHMHRKAERLANLTIMEKFWGAQITSLPLSEYRNSLPTLTEIATLEPRAARSSIPV